MNSTEKGLFITLEGVEGAGKTTQLAFIENYLRQANIDLLVTREPGGTPLGEEIRELLLRPRSEGMTGRAELMLMFAARSEHLEEKIIPALENGTWVLCDRFTDATYAYQGGGRGLDQSLIAHLEEFAQGDLRPDVTIYLDLPVETGLERARQRSEPDRFEQEDEAFFRAVRQTYLHRAEQYPDIYRVIDASKTIDKVQQQISAILSELVELTRY